jgi:hypothetical protein
LVLWPVPAAAQEQAQGWVAQRAQQQLVQVQAQAQGQGQAQAGVRV